MKKKQMLHCECCVKILTEIEQCRCLGKPVLLYFSTVPVVPGSVDADQLKELQNYKAWCQSEGIIQEYCELADLQEKLFRHLTITMRKSQKAPLDLTQDGNLTDREVEPIELQGNLKCNNLLIDFQLRFNLSEKELCDALVLAESKDSFIAILRKNFDIQPNDHRSIHDLLQDENRFERLKQEAGEVRKRSLPRP